MAEIAIKTESNGSLDLIEELVVDAKLIASFGQRAGLFKDTALFDAIQSVEAEGTKPKWSSKSVVALQKALNDAIFAIRPVTLVDLRRGWDPFGPMTVQKRIRAASRFLYVLLALALIFAAVHYTQWLKRAEAIVIVQEQDFSGQIQQKINEMNDTYLQQADGGFDLLDNTSEPLLVELRRQLRETVELVQARDEAKYEYNKVTDRFYLLWYILVPPRDFGRLVTEFKRHKIAVMGAGTSERFATRLYQDCAPAGSVPRAMVDELNGASETGGAPERSVGVSTTATTVGVSEDIQPILAVQDRWNRDYIGKFLLRCLTNAHREVSGQKYDEADLKEKIETVGLWTLPALFGAFGAVVYHLRACWNELRPDPRFGRAMLRVFLGAFGGIAFGWFWSPSSTADFLPATLPLGAYAIAFLIGYSIDIFFTFLDRLVATMSGAIERIGSPKPAS